MENLCEKKCIIIEPRREIKPTNKRSLVIRISGDAYNELIRLCNQSFRGTGDIASELIVKAAKHAKVEEGRIKIDEAN